MTNPSDISTSDVRDQIPADRIIYPIEIVLDNLRSAFNVGSIFRTSDAGAASHLHLCGMTPRPPHPRLARTALGAQECVAWTGWQNAEEAIIALKNKKIPVIAIESFVDASTHVDFDWPRPLALVFGHEVRGIQPAAMKLCDAAVRIPMLGKKNTINVATAYGVVLYEVLRQWRAI